MKDGYTVDERLKSNVRGTHSKRRLSPTRMCNIRVKTFDMYPLTQKETEKGAWAECVRAIDGCNRSLSRKSRGM